MKNPLPMPAVIAVVVIAVVLAGAFCLKAVSGSQSVEMKPMSAVKGGGKMGVAKKEAEKPKDNGGSVGLVPH